MTNEAATYAPHDHHEECAYGEASFRIESYTRVDLEDRIVQIGICCGCGETLARHYVITGPGTGPWTVLRQEEN